MKQFIALAILSLFFIFTFTNCQKETTTVNITDTLIKTLVLQPGPDEGQNCLVNSTSLYAAYNINGNPDIVASTWTYNAQGGTQGTARTYLKFIGLDGMPDSAIILSAKLSLYGISVGTASPQGNSGYPGSPYSLDNDCWLKRVTADWNPDSLTWNNAPSTTDVNESAIPASTTQWNNDANDIDVTGLVDDMLNTHNYGFCLQLQTEDIYRSLSFASCKVADPAKWPKLVVQYKLIH
jgi:hypothetical protein